MIGKKKNLKIETAKHIGGHRLLLTFSDGKEQAVDFGHFLENSRHPEVRKFLNPKKFRSFTIENGDLMWGDFDLIFPIIDLYENKLDHGEEAVSKPRVSSATR
jgi:hypothetical protein